MKMRESRVLRKLRSGEVVFSFKLNLADSRPAQIAAMAGFDCLWLDMEHVPNDWSVIEAQILAAKIYDVDTLIRVPRGSYSNYIKPLELDAAGIMVPHVMNLADAKNVVRMARFHPIGRRPIDGGNADGSFCQISSSDYTKQANEQRFIILQIEDPEPLDDLDQIAALEGIDMLFFGPGDFSHSIGVPGELNHPKLVEASARIVEAATRHGKFAGTVSIGGNFNELIELGYSFINLGSDVRGLGEYCNKLISNLS